MCYVIPTIGALIGSIACRRKASASRQRLFLLFLGGAAFGIVDHLWNGELFCVSDNLASDLLLGGAIAIVILALWALWEWRLSYVDQHHRTCASD